LIGFVDMSEKLKEILNYKQLIKNLVARDLKVKYRGSVIGFFWSLLNPLVTMIVYTVVFTRFLPIGDENFPIFLMSGLLPWIFFSTSLSMATSSITGASNLVKKVYFPREILPLAVTLSNLVQFLLTFLVLFPGILFFHIKINIFLILIGLPLVLFLHLVFTLGLTLIISALSVYYTDTPHFLEIVVMVWFWATPIIYKFKSIPDDWKRFIVLNPLTSFINIYRDICFYNNIPSIYEICLALFSAIISLGVGLWVFGKLKRRFGEEL
jgi:ABC-type polysaccharide/polyol phosphate export permease